MPQDDDTAIGNGYGTWSVSTEDDDEGRRSRHLGVFTGTFHEIALHLADKCFYTLSFESVDAKQQTFPPTRLSVDVTFDGCIEKSVVVARAASLCSGHPVVVRHGKYYASAEIIAGSNPEDQHRKRLELIRSQAMKKLSADEIAALGLTA